MRTLAAFVACILCACNPYIDLKRGVASAGFMNKNQAFAGKMKTADGATASWSTVASDATDVPIAGVNAIGTAAALKWASRTQINQDTAKHVSDNKTAVDIKAIDKPPVQPVIVPEGSTAVFPH